MLAAFALFFVLVMPLAGTWPDQSASAQGTWDFWMESDMDLYGNDQTIRLFGNIGYAIADHPVAIQVFDERNNRVDLDQVQTDSSGDFEATVGPIPDDGSYMVQAEHEFAGSAWTTFTIEQPLSEVVQEEEPLVPELEHNPPPAQETVSSIQEAHREDILRSSADLRELFESGFYWIFGNTIAIAALVISVVALGAGAAIWKSRSRRGARRAADGVTLPSESTHEPELQTSRAQDADGSVVDSLRQKPPDRRDPLWASSQNYSAVIASSQKAVEERSPLKTSQSGYRVEYTPPQKASEVRAPKQELQTMDKTDAPTSMAASETKTTEQESQAAATDIPSMLQDKFIVLDTNACIRHIYLQIKDVDGISDGTKNAYNSEQYRKTDPRIPDCIDIALKNDKILLPEKTTTEFNWYFQNVVHNMAGDDHQRMNECNLYRILTEIIRHTRNGKRYSELFVRDYKESDRKRVQGMYRDFASSIDPKMIRKMQWMYDKEENKARNKKNQTRAAAVQDMRINKKSPLGDGDGKILATVLTISAELSPLCLLTMDGDMINLADDIRKEIGVEVVGGLEKK